MFRRKEENSPELIPSDSATPQANGSASPASSSGHASSPLQESGAPVSSSSTAPSSYAPRALEQPQPRPATAPAASAASSAPYRPAPISNSSSDLPII